MCVRRPEDLGFRSVVTTEEKVAFFLQSKSADTTDTKVAKKEKRRKKGSAENVTADP